MAQQQDVQVCPLQESDIPAAAEIVVEAFNTFNQSVGLPPELPSSDVVHGYLKYKLHAPLSHCVLACGQDGKPIGSNFIMGDPDSKVWAMGPVTVSTHANSSGVGRAVVQACVEGAEEKGAKSLRLLQLTSNTKSFALYSKFNFEPKLVVAYFEGYPKAPLEVPAAYTVRKLEERDINGCDKLFSAANGYFVAKTLSMFTKVWPYPMFVALKDGEVVAYTTAFLLMGHTVAQDKDAFVALFSGASAAMQREERGPPPSFHLPVTLAPELNRWALSVGLRLTRHAWVMVKGSFKELPKEPLFCPSIDWQ